MRFLGDLLVDRAEERRQAFEHRDLGSQTAPDRTHLESDDARANHAQTLGYRADAQRAVVRQDLVLIERGTWQRTGVRAGGQDDVLAHDGLTGRAGHRNLVAAVDRLRERAAAVEERHLVLLEEVQDAVVVLLDHGVLAPEHLGHVDAQVVEADAVIGKGVTRVLEVLARLQQRLRRDAPDVGAGAARSRAALVVFPLVDARRAEPQLCRADGGHIAARPATDDHHIKLLTHEQFPQMSNNRRDGSSSATFIVTRPSTASRPSMMRWSYDMAR